MWQCQVLETKFLVAADAQLLLEQVVEFHLTEGIIIEVGMSETGLLGLDSGGDGKELCFGFSPADAELVCVCVCVVIVI